MDGWPLAIVEVPVHEASGPGAVLAVAGACIWMVSLLVGWLMPVPLIVSLGRATLMASAVALLALLTGLMLLVAAASA